MTLKQVIKTFEIIASHQPSINMVVENDIFRLNNKADARYGVFGWTQGQHQSGTDANMISYQFTFFYVDRLTDDKSNQIEIQSVGVETLDNICKKLNDMGLFIDTYTFQPFNQRFLDECAGVFSSVRIEVPAGSLCSEDFADFNDDFNDDFLVF